MHAHNNKLHKITAKKRIKYNNRNKTLKKRKKIRKHKCIKSIANQSGSGLLSFLKPQEQKKISLNNISVISNLKPCNSEPCALGKGNFGIVMKYKCGSCAKSSNDPIDVAVKTLNSIKNNDEFLKEANTTWEIAGIQNNNNIVKMFGITQLSPSNSQLFDGMVLEYCINGELHQWLIKNNAKPFYDMYNDIMIDIARGMDFIHKLDFVHRDLATRNILLDINFSAKIADFGLTCFKDKRKNKITQFEGGGKISPLWTHPTAVKTNVYNEKTDIWSYGLTCWQIWMNGEEIYKISMLAQNSMLTADNKPTNCPDNLWNIIYKCLHIDITYAYFADIILALK